MSITKSLFVVNFPSHYCGSTFSPIGPIGCILPTYLILSCEAFPWLKRSSSCTIRSDGIVYWKRQSVKLRKCCRRHRTDRNNSCDPAELTDVEECPGRFCRTPLPADGIGRSIILKPRPTRRRN